MLPYLWWLRLRSGLFKRGRRVIGHGPVGSRLLRERGRELSGDSPFGRHLNRLPRPCRSLDRSRFLLLLHRVPRLRPGLLQKPLDGGGAVLPRCNWFHLGQLRLFLLTGQALNIDIIWRDLRHEVPT